MLNKQELQILVNGVHINPVNTRKFEDVEIFKHFTDVLIEILHRHPSPTDLKSSIDKLKAHISNPSFE